MGRNAHRIGAVFYVLWGIIHILGGFAILATLRTQGGAAALTMLGTGAPADHLVASTTPVIDHLIGYHAFNILWIGLFAVVVAMRFNWRNSRAGYWANLVVVSTFDIGLIVFEVLPGSIAVSDAMIGVSLWIPAVVFSTLGIRRRQPAEAPNPNLDTRSLTLDT